MEYKAHVQQLRLGVLGFLAILLLLLFYFIQVGILEEHFFAAKIILAVFSIVVVWFGYIYLEIIEHIDNKLDRIAQMQKEAETKAPLKRITKKSKTKK